MIPTSYEGLASAAPPILLPRKANADQLLQPRRLKLKEYRIQPKKRPAAEEVGHDQTSEIDESVS